MSRTILIVGALACAWQVCLSPRVHAQDRVPPRVALARIAVSESGWDGKRDRAAIWHVLSRRAERHGMRLTSMARAYSSRVFDTERTDARRWIASLDARHALRTGGAPEHFPERLPWRIYRSRWSSILAQADAFLRDHVRDPCGDQAPDHWGMSLPGSIDYRRATSAGWERVDCGDTHNAFWRVPRTLSAARARGRRRSDVD